MLIFSRVGLCLMLMPGLGSARVPMHVRLFLALGLSVVLSMSLDIEARTEAAMRSPVAFLTALLGETWIGAAMGIGARMFILALQTMGTAIANFIGFTGPGAPPIDELDAVPTLTTMLTLAATMLMFAGDLHLEIIRALARSYEVVPMGQGAAPDMLMRDLVGSVHDTFKLGLRLSMPYLVYALMVNFLFGVVNRLVPTIPAYFISFPFVLAGGLLLLHETAGEVLLVFQEAFASWVRGSQ